MPPTEAEAPHSTPTIQRGAPREDPAALPSDGAVSVGPDFGVSAISDGRTTLLARLFAAHVAVATPLVLALVLILGGVRHLSGLISDVADGELRLVHTEELVHKAAWSLETAARRATIRCAASAAPADSLAQPLAELQRASASLPQGSRLRAPIDRYQELARELVADPSCATLLAPATTERRQQLEEDLDAAWISRGVELHREMARKEAEAATVARATLWLGVGLSLVALAFGAHRARRIARAVTEPVASLGVAAARIAVGDFRPLDPPQAAPRELSALFTEVDSMRARVAELDALKQDFVSSVSHELRTPLTKLREALSLLVDGVGGPLSPRQARLVSIAQHACERQIETVSLLLELSRLRAERARLPVSDHRLGAVVEAAAAGVADLVASRGVEVRATGALDAIAPVQPELLRHALENLLRNAASVSPKGGVVEVRVDVGDGRARLSVKDAGPGVPASIRSTLFVPFATEEVVAADRPRGVGLGLAFSREVARAHGGDLELLSSSDSGACFALTLPLR